MRYRLIENSHAGVITDPAPVLLDIAETFKVTFELPRAGAYIALFRDERGMEYKAVIYAGAVIVPKEIIGREQRVGLTVCLTDGDKILWAWECHPLKVGAFLRMRKTQWQITAGFSDEELLARLAEIERTHAATEADFDALKRDCAEKAEAFSTFAEEIGERIAKIEEAKRIIVEAVNKATEVINDLSERVAALEKNYDPTLIK